VRQKDKGDLQQLESMSEPPEPKVTLEKGMLVTTKTGLTAKVFSVHSDGYVMLETYGVFRQEDVRPAKRLAKGADGVERPWEKRELFMLYMRGWRDGSGQRAMREEAHLRVPEYDQGYADGYEARQRASARAAKRLKYKPEILRLVKGKNELPKRRRRGVHQRKE
jgi:hypothetical protein